MIMIYPEKYNIFCDIYAILYSIPDCNMKPKVSKSYKCVKTLESVYTGGQADWAGGYIWSLHRGGVNVVREGTVVTRVEEEEDPVICFTLSPDKANTCLVTAHKSGLVKIWEWENCDEKRPEIVRTFRSIHTGIISLMSLHKVGESAVLATGGSDGSVKVWDLSAQYFTHNLRTANNVCTTITFHPQRLLLYAGWVTGALTVWDLTSSNLLANMEAHYSAVTSLVITEEGSRAVSGGRDSVVVVWELSSHTKLATVPVFSPVEGLQLTTGHLTVILATKHKLAVWSLEGKPKLVRELDIGSNVTRLTRSETEDTYHVTTSDHNLMTVKLRKDIMVVTDTVVGDNDQVLALGLLGQGKEEAAPGTHLAVACNSPAVRLYNRNTWQCSLHPGHTDTVLCLACHEDSQLLVTGSKDNTIRVWRLEAGGLTSVAVGAGHTKSVGGVAWAGDGVVSVSADTTLKVWSLNTETGTMVSTRTEIAHEKDINCVAVSPDSGLIVTGGQDKLAKLWRSADLGLVSVLRGHSRGVWCAQFSPADRLVATGAGDAVVRLWSISEGSGASCVRQLQGHEASVLSLAWASGGQLVTGSSDGLLKVWWVARQECTVTLDLGEEAAKVWSVVTEGDEVMAGGDGGRILVWKDDTDTVEAARQEDQDKIVVQHQRLSNLLQEKNWAEAVKLALRLSQPLTALKIIKKLQRDDLVSAVEGLDNTGLDQLLGYIVQWNSNTRHSTAAQNMLHSILTSVSHERLLKLPNIQSHVECLLPYTEKHYNRLQSLNTKTKFIPYMLHSMKATNVPVS